MTCDKAWISDPPESSFQLSRHSVVRRLGVMAQLSLTSPGGIRGGFRHQPLRTAAVAVALIATVPYLVLKAMWLSGSTIGIADRGHLEEMQSTRFQVGNSLTVLLMLVAAALVVALTRSWADQVPAKVVLVLGAGATGLLVPIVLGLPLGLVAQVLANGDVQPAEDGGLQPWVFGVVYTGFALLAVAMGVLLLGHVARRWGHLIKAPPERLSWPATVAGALGLLPFATAMIAWGAFGPGRAGPQGMDQPAQRTVLVVTGILSGAAFVLPRASRLACRWPCLTWLTAWTGCCVAALQGPAQLLLAQGGDPRPAVAAVALLATPGACVYGGQMGAQLARATQSGSAPCEASHRGAVGCWKRRLDVGPTASAGSGSERQGHDREHFSPGERREVG